MKIHLDYQISPPHRSGSLTLFLIQSNDTLPDGAYTALEKAMAEKTTVVHETGEVGSLLIENFGSTDVYAQAGDILKGGRQDRMIQVDFVVPRGSGRMPLPTFCVEQRRWSPRGRERADLFSCSKSYVSSKRMKIAARMTADQGEVWAAVEKAQIDLCHALQEDITSTHSPSSYELTREHNKIQNLVQETKKDLSSIAHECRDAVGLVFALGGTINSADLYGSHDLFVQMWDKLLEAAITESISVAASPEQVSDVDETVVRAFLNRARLKPVQAEIITSRIRLHSSRGKRKVCYDTEDLAYAGTSLHTNILSI